jgi:small-conductance mechanosensitive channel
MGDGLGDWVYVAVVVGGSLLVGLALDIVVVGILRLNAGPGRRGRVAVAKALRGQFEVWAILLGLAVFKPLAFLTADQLEWSGRILLIVAILSITIFLARLAGSLIRAFLAQESVTAPSGTIFVNLARLVIWAVGITFILGALGVEIGPLMASLGVAGLAVSLGLQDTLANFFAGLQVTLSRQIQPGQFIRLSTLQEGLVTDVTWRNTTLLAPSNDLLVIPNTVIATTLVTNFTADDEEHVEAVPFTVTYGSDLDEVKRIAVAVACAVRDAHEDAIDEFEPACTFKAFGPDGIAATVTIRVKRFQDRLPIVSDLVERLHHELAKSGDVELATGLGAMQRAQG